MKVERIITIITILLMIAVPIVLTEGRAGSDDPSVEPPTREGPVTFTNVSKEAGLSHLNGNFFSWGDFDNDEHQDLLVDGKRLFRNSGPPEFVFTDVTEHAGINRAVNSGVFGDFDNDGWLDIFCGGGYGSRDHPEMPDILWHNNRDGTFTDVTHQAGGISDTFPTVAGGWADIDRDGFIDLYMVNYENGTYQGYPDNFWYNDGDGTFTNGTLSSGMDEYDEPLQSRGISFSDFDNDGFIDGYVSNYRITRNYLYHNIRNGTMEEVAAEFGVEGHGNDHPITQDGPYYGHSLGSSWGDLDNDGDMDLWVTNLAHKDAWRGPICDDSYLFENLGPEEGYRFEDVRGGSGIPIKEIPGALFGDGDELMVSSALADYDNDGDLDLYFPQIYSDVSYAHSYLYSNEGGLTFTDVSVDSGIRVWNTYGSAWCDYNEDGWMDLVTGGGNWDGELGRTVNSAIHLYRNNGASSKPDRGWLEVNLNGRDSNTAAIGTRVIVDVDTNGDGEYDLSMMREVNGGTAAHGQQDSMVLHFGLGDPVYDIRVTTKWPMGKEVVMTGVQPNTVLRRFEPTEEVLLNVTLLNFDVTGEGTDIGLQIENPTVFPVVYTEFKMVIEERETSSYHIITYQGRIEPGNNRIDLSAPGIEDDTIANITLAIDRCFPPLAWNPVVTYRHDPLTNLMPIPLISGPSSVEVGEVFEIDGSGSYDKDGTISSYNFDMGDGTVSGWQASSSFSHTYTSPGTYTVHLSVMDDRDGMSIVDGTLMIETTGYLNSAPAAVIEYIKPDEANVGERIRFKGHGIPFEDRTIDGYEWSSSIDGILGDTSYLTVEDLSPGEHAIYFRVMDSEDEWSTPVTGSVLIVEEVIEELWISIDPLEIEGPITGVVKFTGTAGPQEKVEFVEVRIDSGPWEKARTVPEWSYEVDCSSMEPGPHRIDARSFGDRYYSNSYASLEFDVGEEEVPPIESNIEQNGGGLLDLFQDLLLIIVSIGAVLMLLVVAVIFIFFMTLRKNRELKMAREGLPSEDPIEDTVSIKPVKNDGDIEIVKATVIE